MQQLPGAIFQQDNAQPPMARVSQDCFRTVSTLSWPVRSPDLSGIEHIWDHLGQRFGHPTSLNELEASSSLALITSPKVCSGMEDPFLEVDREYTRKSYCPIRHFHGNESLDLPLFWLNCMSISRGLLQNILDRKSNLAIPFLNHPNILMGLLLLQEWPEFSDKQQTARNAAVVEYQLENLTKKNPFLTIRETVDQVQIIAGSPRAILCDYVQSVREICSQASVDLTGNIHLEVA
ncbi:transposable element Tcb2 transposase [Trichonephila clavipes]|nr:transposable element Tcb2 transposase [Trichonephila clavipes]